MTTALISLRFTSNSFHSSVFACSSLLWTHIIFTELWISDGADVLFLFLLLPLEIERTLIRAQHLIIVCTRHWYSPNLFDSEDNNEYPREYVSRSLRRYHWQTITHSGSLLSLSLFVWITSRGRKIEIHTRSFTHTNKSHDDCDDSQREWRQLNRQQQHHWRRSYAGIRCDIEKEKVLQKL